MAPEPVTGVSAQATGPTTARLTWTDNLGSDAYHVKATLPGWRDEFWANADAGGVDLEGLARGGRYTFTVETDRFGGLADIFSSDSYLTLGERGLGPRAPSDLSWTTRDDGQIRLSWKDNSSDELGFEVQSAPAGTTSWSRLATAPPNTESVLLPSSGLSWNSFRVFAYNERGFSASSPRVPGTANVVWLAATAGDAEVCLVWIVGPKEWIVAPQVRWKRTAEMPFDDAVDTWTVLPSQAFEYGGEYIVTGLENGTEYTFEVRVATTGAGVGRAKSVTATPQVPGRASFRLDIPCDEELCRTLTGTPVSFVDTSRGNVAERRWSFGDGAGSDLRSPTHIWSSPGYYDVTLTVSEGSSSDSATRTVLVEAAAPAGSCRADAETLCLQDSRFAVTMEWWGVAGESGVARVVHAGTNDSGLFRFVDPEKWEVLIRVVNGCAINRRTWVMGASTTDLGYRIRVTDTVTGESRSYANDPGQRAPAIMDREAFSGACGTVAAVGAPAVELPGGAGTASRLEANAETSGPTVVVAEQVTGWCEAGAMRLCLHDRRFGVQVVAYTSELERYGDGQVAREGTAESGVFYLSDPEEWEVLVRVVDGCAINGYYWVLAAATGDLALEVSVSSTGPGQYGFIVHRRRPGMPIVDTEAFPGACAAGNPPAIENLTTTAGDAEVGLTWLAPYVDTLTGMQVRWKASADLPFDDAVDPWVDLPASARAHTVTGLRNGTEYAFAVRTVTESGAGQAATVTATPRAPPRAPPGASFTLSVDCPDDPCRVRTGEVVRFTDTSTGKVTEWRWSFGDGAASALRSPTHAWSTPGFYDVTLTVGDGSTSSSATRTVLVEAASPAGSCRFDAETLCLQDSRFEVKADWWNASGESGPGRVVYAGTNDSGLFRFFAPLNWEILIKVLDGCGINGRTWVLGAATTDLGYRIVVTDTVTGESRSYENEPGRPAPAIVDTEAFSLPCGGTGR